jgi:hypothetical protein
MLDSRGWPVSSVASVNHSPPFLPAGGLSLRGS